MNIYILENQGPAERAMWVRPIGRIGPRSAIGAWAVLTTKQGHQLRNLPGGGSYLCTSEQVLHFTWSAGDVPVSLEVHWPQGERTETPLPAAVSSRYLLWEEGRLLTD